MYGHLQYIVVTNNLFYDDRENAGRGGEVSLRLKFDLKGSTIDRRSPETQKRSDYKETQMKFKAKELKRKSIIDPPSELGKKIDNKENSLVENSVLSKNVDSVSQSSVHASITSSSNHEQLEDTQHPEISHGTEVQEPSQLADEEELKAFENKLKIESNNETKELSKVKSNESKTIDTMIDVEPKTDKITEVPSKVKFKEDKNELKEKEKVIVQKPDVKEETLKPRLNENSNQAKDVSDEKSCWYSCLSKPYTIVPNGTEPAKVIPKPQSIHHVPTKKDGEFNDGEHQIELEHEDNVRIVLKQLVKDCLFLKAHHLMDYSLLLGISRDVHLPSRGVSSREKKNTFSESMNVKGKYYYGLIDILQKWTLKKKM